MRHISLIIRWCALSSYLSFKLSSLQLSMQVESYFILSTECRVPAAYELNVVPFTWPLTERNEAERVSWSRTTEKCSWRALDGFIHFLAAIFNPSNGHNMSACVHKRPTCVCPLLLFFWKCVWHYRLITDRYLLISTDAFFFYPKISAPFRSPILWTRVGLAAHETRSLARYFAVTFCVHPHRGEKKSCWYQTPTQTEPRQRWQNIRLLDRHKNHPDTGT